MPQMTSFSSIITYLSRIWRRCFMKLLKIVSSWVRLSEISRCRFLQWRLLQEIWWWKCLTWQTCLICPSIWACNSYLLHNRVLWCRCSSLQWVNSSLLFQTKGKRRMRRSIRRMCRSKVLQIGMMIVKMSRITMSSSMVIRKKTKIKSRVVTMMISIIKNKMIQNLWRTMEKRI